MSHASQMNGRAQVKESTVQAIAAFRREFPELLREHDGEWVVYKGCERLGIDPSLDDLWNRCRSDGHKAEELIFLGIDRDAIRELDGDITIY